MSGARDGPDVAPSPQVPAFSGLVASHLSVSESRSLDRVDPAYGDPDRVSRLRRYASVTCARMTPELFRERRYARIGSVVERPKVLRSGTRHVPAPLIRERQLVFIRA